MLNASRIRKAESIEGQTVVLRNVCVDDAAFILSLRCDPERGQFLNPTSPNLVSQKAYLEAYLHDTTSAYFIIKAKGSERSEDAKGSLGTIRLYDPQGESFCFGSFIVTHDAPRLTAIESLLMIFHFAVDHLYFKKTHFDVRQENIHAWKFYERFGAEKKSENTLDRFYGMSESQIKKALRKHAHFLPEGIHVSPLLS